MDGNDGRVSGHDIPCRTRALPFYFFRCLAYCSMVLLEKLDSCASTAVDVVLSLTLLGTSMRKRTATAPREYNIGVLYHDDQ
eukprot:scaffold2954_cov171-Amphora_coffeaeformis.AAC.2